MAWSDEQKEAIYRAFQFEGESASKIAARYGVSRNAIIGVAHRMRENTGAPKKRAEPRPRPAATAGARKPSRLVRYGTPATSDAMPGLFKRNRKLVEVPAPCWPRSVPLVAVASGECRFPVTPHDVRPSDHLFCGAPADGPYCLHHSRIAFRMAATAA